MGASSFRSSVPGRARARTRGGSRSGRRRRRRRRISDATPLRAFSPREHEAASIRHCLFLTRERTPCFSCRWLPRLKRVLPNCSADLSARFRVARMRGRQQIGAVADRPVEAGEPRMRALDELGLRAAAQHPVQPGDCVTIACGKLDGVAFSKRWNGCVLFGSV